MKIIDTDGTELTETTFEEWDKEWKKEHPVAFWIDTLIKNKGIAGYRGSYAILHPWVMLDYAFREVKYAFQRAFRGWDDTVIWSIDYHLAEMIPVWLMELKKYKGGVPQEFIHKEDEYVDEHGIWTVSKEGMQKAEAEYDAVLDIIMAGFNAYKDLSDCKFDYGSPKEAEATRIYEEGFDLFRKYFGTFWD
jgi:hypothetical protein